MADATELRYNVIVKGSVEVLGRLTGVLQRSADGASWRNVVLTLRVPSDARVGLLDVADVVFQAPDDRSATVPVVLRVPAIVGMRLDGPREFRDLRAGDRLEIAYRVQNVGNDVESVVVQLRAPDGWLGRTADSLVVEVLPFATADVRLNVRVPATVSGGGEYRVTAMVRSTREGSAELARLATDLSVVAREAKREDIMFRPTSVAVASSQGSGLTTGFRADGEISDGVYLRATVMPQRPQSGLEAIALASVGALGLPFQASLSSATWNADIGMVSAALNPLTGVNAVAEGVSLRGRFNGRETTVFAGRSGLRGNATGSHVGAGTWWQTGFGRVGGSASRMRESFGSGFSRDLTSLGADWSGSAFGNWAMDGGLALRSFGGGEHLGYRLGGARDYDRGIVRLGFTHAPGGSAAFANGVDNFDASVQHAMNERWRMDANVIRVRDIGGGGFSSRSTAVGLGQQYEWTEQTTFSLRGMSSQFQTTSATAGLGRFGSSTHSLSGGANHRVGGWTFNSNLQVGIVGRDAELFSGAVSEVRVLQRGLQGGVSRNVARLGQISTGFGRMMTGAGTGQPTDVTSAFARLAAVPVMVGAFPVRMNADMQYIGSAERSALIGLRFGASTPLPGGLELASTVERNPFFVDRNGNAGWIMALRVSAATSVFSPRRSGAGGVVFEDLNGNGLRDPGEPGVAGVRLRQGETRMRTDRDGNYTVPVGVRGVLELEAAAVPLGLVLHPRAAASLSELRDFPLVPTGVMTLQINIDADADGRRPEVDLAPLVVWLTDADGREWVGRAIRTGEFRFENIPVGRYSVRFDLSQLSEPLRTTGDESVLVTRGAETRNVVSLRGREVRFIQPPGRGGQGSGRGGRGTRAGAGGQN